MLSKIRIFNERGIALYRKELYNKAISLVNSRMSIDPFDGTVVWDEKEFASVPDAVQYVAKLLNRRGNRDAVPYKDWLFHNRLQITDWRF